MTDARIYRFRLRLCVAAGIALGSGRFAPVARAGSDASSGGSSSSDGSSSSGAEDDEEIGQVCGGGCYGRPYVVDRHARTAIAVDDAAWRDELRIAGLDRLGAAQREALVTFWTDAALSEHSSVAGFHRFTLDLLAHGAPAQLIAAAQRAAVQELEHARACFELASAYAGRGIGPGPIPLGTHAPIARDLVELAVWTVREGCVGETIAAWVADEIHLSSEEPSVRSTMAKIAAEELEHAALAWSTIRWAMDRGGDTVVRAIDDAFRSARVQHELEARLDCLAHGLMPSARVAGSIRRALEEIVQPCALRLVS